MQEVFKARVINGNRITIPEPSRVVLGVKEGDIVAVTLKKTVPQGA